MIKVEVTPRREDVETFSRRGWPLVLEAREREGRTYEACALGALSWRVQKTNATLDIEPIDTTRTENSIEVRVVRHNRFGSAPVAHCRVSWKKDDHEAR